LYLDCPAATRAAAAHVLAPKYPICKFAVLGFSLIHPVTSTNLLARRGMLNLI